MVHHPTMSTAGTPTLDRAPEARSPASGAGPTNRDERRAEFEALLVPLLPRAYSAARYLTGNRTDAEELVQDTALLAWRGFDGFRPGTNFRAWFLRIMTNHNYTRLRRDSRTPGSASLEDVPDLYLYGKTGAAGLHGEAGDPARTLLSKLDAREIRGAIEGLPDEFREVAALYFADGLSYREIADAVGCPVGTVRSRLHRGRRMLQVALWRLAEEHGIVPSDAPA